MNAHGSSSKWGRLALVAVALVAAVTLALPASALARTVTRLVVVKSVTVDNGDPLATAWPYSLTVKLQKRVTSTHYHALSGTVKVYRYDVDDSLYHYVMKRTGSTISFPMPSRGKYKFVYSGSSTMKPCTAYSTLYEDIGFELAATGMSVTPFSPTQSWITFTYTASWNTNAWTAPVWFSSDMYFGTTESVWVYYERRLQAPGAVEFTFKIDNSEILPELWDSARAYISYRDDLFIIDSDWLENHHYMTS
jgi:hypothetical protein